jgi:type II secretory pathway pseudopilin PulG
VASESKVAFSLAEMAIVMVIVGLILSMAVKGHGMYQTAVMRKEVGKLRKFETAFAAYYAKTNNPFPVVAPPNMTGGGGYAWDLATRDAFIAAGYLNNDDLTFKFTKDVPTFVLGLEAADGEGYKYSTAQNMDNATSVGLSFKSAFKSFICSIELIYDDKNVVGGNGRLVGTEYTYLGTADFTDCLTLTGIYQDYWYLLLRF